MTDSEALTQEILDRHPDWEDQEREKELQKIDDDCQHWEVGSDHR